MKLSPRLLAWLLSGATLISSFAFTPEVTYAEEITEGTEETEESPEPEEPEVPEVIPGYFVSYEDESARFTVKYDGQTITSQKLFVVYHSETQEYTIADPLTAAAVYKDSSLVASIISIDKNGIGTVYGGTATLSITFKDTTASFSVKNGKIVLSGTTYKTSKSVLYQTLPNGRVRKFTGTYNKQLYYDGVLIRKKYVILKKAREAGVTIYNPVNPNSSANNENTLIYYADKNAKGSRYTGTGILSIYYSGAKKACYVSSGSIVHYSKNTLKAVSGYLYQISIIGRASKYTGYYKDYLYISGLKKTGVFYAFKNNAIYVSDKNGKLKKYTTSGKSSYYKLCYCESGSTVLVKATPSGEATLYCPSSTEATAYLTVSKTLYAINTKTGKAKAFTGVYKNKYYSGGKIYKPSNTVRRVASGYIYTVYKDGSARKYIRDKSNTKKYLIYVNGQYHYCYYNTGKVYKTLTSEEARQRIVDKAKSYLGLNEKDGSCKKIISIYNNYKPLPVGYKLSVKWNSKKGAYNVTAWCAAFASVVFISSGMSDIMAVECGCERQTELWKKRGCWIENDKYKPKPGDIIYFSWNAKGSGDWTEMANHVGIVIAYDDDTEMITTIEGNTGPSLYRNFNEKQKYEGVYKKLIPWNDVTIRGFASPKY